MEKALEKESRIGSMSREKREEAGAKLKELFWDDLALIEITKAAKTLFQEAEEAKKEEMRAGFERQIAQLEQASLKLLAERMGLEKLLGKSGQS